MSENTDRVDTVVDVIITTAARRRVDHAEAARWVERELHIPRDLLDSALERIKHETDAFEAVLNNSVVKRESYSELDWYRETRDDGHWAKYLRRLQDRGAPGLDSLEEETRNITRLLANPNTRGQKRKGLVMGNVQSGKTRNFAGVIARAADAGYKMVIVLSGIHNNLREQTQTRLNQDLFEDPWYPVTTAEEDFVGVTNLGLLLRNQEHVSAVIKKNTAPLRKLTQALGSVPEDALRRYPILIIDDEADQATPNSARGREAVSAINRHLRELWSLVQTGTYVAYTATPFANVLIDPEEPDDLFPEDFVTTISTGDGYFGAEQVFGITEWINEDGSSVDPGLDMVREVSQEEADDLKPPSDKDERVAHDPEPPPSLIEAVEWFVVACATRRARGQIDHSSMLVHVTHYADPHTTMQRRLIALVAEMRKEVEAGSLERFEASWDREAHRVQQEGIQQQTWEEVQPHIVEVLSSIDVIVDNGRSNDRLNYDGDAKTVIAVGGGTLSRGLTLEGLVVSYFTRTSSSYDTLLQMGRWFGYRPGYADLPRIWVSPGLADDYAFLAKVERDLREEIESFKGSAEKPRDLGVRVRVHPGRLSVTAENKMQAANVVQIGFSGILRQVYILDGSDESIAQGNLRAIESMVANHPLEPLPWAPTRYMAERIAGRQVRDFLESFSAHPSHKWLMDTGESTNLSNWIEKYADGPVWNVIIMGNSNPGPNIDVAGVTVRGLNRNALGERTKFPGTIDLGAVVSQTDRIADIDPALYEGEASGMDKDRRRIRREHGRRRGLIILYPISGFNEHSRPQSAEPGAARVPMEVEHHQWAFAIIGPNVDDTDGSNDVFISVRPTWEMAETAEDEDELEAALNEEDDET